MVTYVYLVCVFRFYYDFFNEEKKMTDADLKLIKKEMEKIIKKKLPLLREEVTRYKSLAERLERLPRRRDSLGSHDAHGRNDLQGLHHSREGDWYRLETRSELRWIG